MKKRFLCMLLAIVMVVGLMPASVLALDDTTNILVIGDSISTGYGLAAAETESFAALLNAEEGYTVVNKAVDGNTVVGIAAQLQYNNITQADIEAADVITITVGGNDLMALLYEAIAAEYNKLPVAASAPITAVEVLTIMSNSSDGRRLSVMSTALGLLNEDSDIYLLDDQVFADAVRNYIFTLNQVINAIKTLNEDATVIVATQYNPYVEFNGAFFNAFIMNIDLTPIYSGMEVGVTALNTAIKNNAATGGYLVADVKAAFDEQTADLYVADPTALNLDFHPNAAGHAVIADTFMEILTSYNTVAEASWGASESSLTNSGTLKEAVAAAAVADSNVKYIKMNRDVDITATNHFNIEGGDFTLDMGGYEMSWGSYQLYISGGKVVFKNGTFSSTHNYGIKVEGDMEDTEITFESGTYSALDSVVYVNEAKLLTVMEDVSMTADIPVYIGSDCAASLIDGADLSGTSADIAIRGGTNVVTKEIYDFDVDGDEWSLDLSSCPMYPYTDLDTGLWYHDGIHYCIEHDLMVGTGTNIFEPNTATSRAMIVTILWRLEGSPVVNYTMDFEDVAADQWYTEAIRWAASEKIVEGYGNGKFGTNDAITREQLVTIMFRFAKYKGYDVSVGENTNILSYDDTFDMAEWAIPAMQWACGSGMIQGIADGNTMNLAPQGNATRAQAAAILQRYCENVANKD